MRASEFVSCYAAQGPSAWEAAIAQLAREGGLLPVTWYDVQLSDGRHHATARVSSDYFWIGDGQDNMLVPLTPTTAQTVANALGGLLLPTPKLVYETWRQAPNKLSPTPMAPNRGANLDDYFRHSRAIDQQLGGRLGLVSGHKKDVVVSNAYQPGKVIIFGWYKPTPDVFDNRLPMGDPARQPIQPLSNVHGAGYVDYSHGIRLVHPKMVVDGVERDTESVYTDPILSSLVSHEGPIRTPRYPGAGPILRPHTSQAFAILESHFPRAKPYGPADLGLAELMRREGVKPGGGT